jgi:transcriptional regulator with XRE-family HTH domain
MNQKQFAERVGMSVSNYNYLESGRIGYTQKSLEAIAEALDVTPASLLSRDPVAQQLASDQYQGSPREELDDVIPQLTDDDHELLLHIAKKLHSRILAKMFSSRSKPEKPAPLDAER